MHAMMIRRLLLAAVLLAGCTTPYQAKGKGSLGYSETLLAPDVIEVFFDGNSKTPVERASDYALLRCAEYSLEHGYTHFVVLERTSSVETAFVNGGGGRAKHSPHSIARVRMTKSAEDGALDAAFLIQSIKTKYGMF
jgi:hypothetical protein